MGIARSLQFFLGRPHCASGFVVSNGPGGDPEKIVYASCDLGDAYPAGIRRNFPNAIIIFDHFHAVKLLSDAFDVLIRREMAKNEIIRGLRKKLLMNPSAFSE